ncbi:MAG: hypothetical protein HXX13_17545 [Bacteroidetes bacterium]|nr:hypothetical protein [Bacteroidota bacterium]
MKTTRFFGMMALMMAIVMLSLSSCKKDSNTEPTAQKNKADENSAFAEKTFKDLGGITDKAMNNGQKMMKSGLTFKQSENTCMTITLDLSHQPYVLTIDFGATNCQCDDGHYRRGKIIVTYTQGFGDSLTSLSTTLDNYFDNDNQILGTRTVTYLGHNAAGHLNWEENVDGSIILANNGGTITYQSHFNFEMIEGEATPLVVEDNTYSITGSASGTTVLGQSFSNVITSPLIYKMSCTYAVSGVIEITPAGEPVRVLDYGNGECDNLATVTVSGYTINLILP